MKLYLDDEREAPEGWVLVKTVDECIRQLKDFQFEELSLDHDLGLRQLPGYDVLLWLEGLAFSGDWKYIPRVIKIHSANSSARIKMELAIEQIMKLRK